MVNYEINTSGNTYAFVPTGDIILIGRHMFKNQSEGDLLKYMTDNLTHEHIHRAIYKLFGSAACRLFDAVEHNFRNQKLHETIIKDSTISYIESYDTYIKRNGFNAFLELCHISNEAFNQAYIVCNNRLKGDI